MPLYDGNGNQIGADFSVEDYSQFDEWDGKSARQGTLVYNGSRFFPYSYEGQRKQSIKQYGGGVMLTLGDSYTAFMETMFDTFAEKHGLVQDNRGLASSTIAGSQDGVTIGYHAFWTRLDEAVEEYASGKLIGDTTYHAEDVKLVTFMGGANDWSTVNDSIDRFGNGPNETNKEKLYGALNYIFSTLLSTFQNADIVCILQPTNYSNGVPSDEDGAKNIGFESLEQAQGMTDAQCGVYQMIRKESIVSEMAKRYSLHICDCCFDFFSPINPQQAQKYWQSDKLHLTDEGHAEIIKKLEYTVNSIE